MTVAALVAALATGGWSAAPGDTVHVRAGARDTAIVSVASAAGPAVRAAGTFPLVGVRVASPGPGRFTLTRGGNTVTVVDGAPFATVKGKSYPLVAPPTLRGGELLIPITAMGELVAQLGPDLSWDGDRHELRLMRGDVAWGAHPVAPTAKSIAESDATMPPPSTWPAAPSAVVAQSAPRTVPVARPATQRSTPASPPPAPPLTHAASVETPAAPSTPTPSAPARRAAGHRVVVDAGHGGPDNGMHGPIGGRTTLYEKDITLAVSKRLASELRERGLDVVMTRTTDTLIALGDRGKIANQRKGDLFISIHVNAANPNWKSPGAARGFETYFLSDAKTEDERRVANMENESVRFDGDVDVGKGDPLNFLLTDMLQNEHLRESSDLATVIQRKLGAMHPGPSRGVKQAGFRVLVTSFMPSVLVEIGFGTNPAEAAYIGSDDGQRRIAAAVADAAVEYLAHYEKRTGSTASGAHQ